MDDFLSLPHFDTSEDDDHMRNAPPSFDTNYYDQEHTSSSYLNAHENDTINILSPSYSDIYQHGFMNALSSPYPNNYDLAGSSRNMYNFDPLGFSLQLNNDVLIESDVETRSGDINNGFFDDEQDQEYEDSENEEQDNSLVLKEGIEFETWELAESYLNDYAKKKGFSFRKKCVL
ncbi:hypothetical protein F8M41_004677 [Gigaspora margarita]|uniref:Uncharacterized protein n=1 Tax=Gigaspora margarita TaxID=4874 RepID=A0A8H3XBC0_GIGMA|nr:hypothetical protein F8M41_004677 [Gigaspora margarita]